MKAGTFTKFWAVLMTLVVIAVAILAGVWFSNGTLTYNGGGEDEEEPVAVTEDGSELESGGTVPMQNMTFKSAKTLATGADAQNEEYASVTLTATVTPSWATQALSWSVAFSNPSSEWATGKTVTDYVTVTPGETTLTATVQCLQPFGEQIIVTVSADEFDDVSATCTVDFQRRLLRTLIYTEDYPEGTELEVRIGKSDADTGCILLSKKAIDEIKEADRHRSIRDGQFKDDAMTFVVTICIDPRAQCRKVREMCIA